MLVWTLLACLLLQLGFVHLPVLQSIFGSAALDAAQWAKVALAGGVVFLGTELDKWRARRAAQRR